MAFDATLALESTGGAVRTVRLADFLDADGDENAARAANAWIKSLRQARVDGVSFRERFRYRDDSLWWFAELYLHKERAVLSLFRAIAATTTLLDRESPQGVRMKQGDDAARLVVPQLMRARGLRYEGPTSTRSPLGGLGMDARSTALMLAAVASPDRPSRIPSSSGVTVAAFVHRAFWRGDTEDGSAESYIGPVLHALEARLPKGAVRHVGIGPSTNFRARRWWRRAPSAARVVQPIEGLVPRTELAGSSGLWAARHAMRRAMTSSNDLRASAIIAGCDCWPIVEAALAGIALLQFPWSARAMDEAGAAFEALQPSVAVTYAEAGGWGRALALEARRRSIPLAGLQHGFIYRHWLNYLHEPDEMEPLSPTSADRGFPRPSITLLFDEYAANHLAAAGRFPRESLAVTGSPRLDDLSGAYARLQQQEVDRARNEAGADPSRHLVLLVTKYSEVHQVLRTLLAAVRAIPDAHLAIKTHPAETPDLYAAAAAGQSNVRILPASAPLAPLLRASRAVVTVNSTVALDAMTLGIPALSIGLPNNLSPFVSMGAVAGASASDDLRVVLEQLLYDEGFRQRLAISASSVVDAFRMAPDGRAADRSAEAVLGLAQTP